MTAPQPGIFVEGSRHHHFLEYRANANAESRQMAAAVTALRRAADASPAHMVIAFGKAAWTNLAAGAVPDGARDFQTIAGPGHAAPATQRDVLVWVHGDDHDDVLDLALAADTAMAPHGAAELDLAAFQYRDSRDLTGFIDGTANPKEDARMEAALVPAGQPGGGGAFVLTQKWRHDLTAFNGLAVDDQQRVIGRTKPDSIELEGDAMPPWSHVSRTDVKVDGVAQKIYRRSAPYGTPSEHGLYFIAFARDIGRFQVQLERMFGVSGDGEYDHLIDYSRALTGSYWFAPSAPDLAAL